MTKDLKDDHYDSIKTPEVLEDGALRPGGAPKLFSRDYIGLVAQYACVGLVDTVLPGVVYPFMQAYLNVEGSQALTAVTVLAMPWSFKVFYGILSDCFPICGYRRRPYMVLGWFICFIFLLVCALTPVPEPYYPNPALRAKELKNLTSEELSTLNISAQYAGGKYVLYMMFCGFGYLMADVAADGVVCEVAQQEPASTRGHTQSVIYSTRTLFSVLGHALVGFLFNGEQYNGTFSFSLSFTHFMWILLVALGPIVPISWFFIKEERRAGQPFLPYMREFWTIIQTRAVYQVIFYQFLWGIFSSFSYTAVSPIQLYWVDVRPVNEKISQIIGSLIFIAAIGVTRQYGLQWNWRFVIIVTSLIVIALDAFTTFLTVWGVVRNQWFWLGVPIAINVPAGISFIISTFVTVELARDGHEGAMYGLLTTTSNLAYPFAATLTKIVNAQMADYSIERIKTDSNDVRWDVTYAVLLMYAMTIVGFGWLVFLPPQKEQTQELIRTGGSSRAIGLITVAYLAFALIWSITTNILGLFENTACLVIAGGEGC